MSGSARARYHPADYIITMGVTKQGSVSKVRSVIPSTRGARPMGREKPRAELKTILKPVKTGWEEPEALPSPIHGA